jgi:hypothetical protein
MQKINKHFPNNEEHREDGKLTGHSRYVLQHGRLVPRFGVTEPRFINGRKPLRQGALKPEIASGGKKFVAVALSMFNIVHALSRFAEHPF